MRSTTDVLLFLRARFKAMNRSGAMTFVHWRRRGSSNVEVVYPDIEISADSAPPDSRSAEAPKLLASWTATGGTEPAKVSYRGRPLSP